MEQEPELERHKLFLEHSAAIVTVVDRDGTITYQSPTIDRILGYDPDQLIGETALEYIHPDDTDRVVESFQTAIENPESEHTVEYRFKRADGSWAWLHSIGISYLGASDIDGFIINSIDVTDLKVQEQHYQSVLENINDGVVIIEDEEITYVNSRIVELTEFPQSDALGEQFTKFVAEKDRQLVNKRYQKRIREDETVPDQQYQIHILTDGGKQIPVELSVGDITFNGEQKVIAVVRDIRERHARGRQLRVLDRVLRHNLRNTMTSIKGNVETIRRETAGVEELIRNILDQIDQLLETVDKEREVVDILCESPEPVAIDVYQVCQNKIESVDSADANIELTRETATDMVASATNDIGRAIEELIENAISHNDQLTPEVRLSIERTDDWIRVSVADNGPGIPEDEINALTAGYEVNQLYHGSGLGLWLINWIVRQSGGVLSFQENDPRGSIATIELPTWT